ncbi:hypothetical protein TNIN_443281 [Trichonephila inaurata madagascariensis]|uniref:Uncharacterized protein n=1 Tax=Trichonephila inaurata madagascariensis TaxID=2747483 RepID=A0A8X6YPA1_9ARAC|nr:hypothetical protein TNIN_443281 [Trichonephila inaurata madagascariensis]
MKPKERHVEEICSNTHGNGNMDLETSEFVPAQASLLRNFQNAFCADFMLEKHFVIHNKERPNIDGSRKRVSFNKDYYLIQHMLTLKPDV